MFCPHSDSNSTPLIHAAATRVTGIVGGWGVAFLLMQLSRLQAAQKQAREDLQKRVEERTAELSEAYISLQKENERRILVEESLRISEDRLRVVLESTADGILAVDTSGRTLLANRRFADLWRIPKHLIDRGNENSMLTFSLDQLIDPSGFLLKIHMLRGTNKLDQDLLFFKDGRVFERYSAPMIKGESVIGRVWSYRDITEQRRVHELLTRLEEEQRIILNTVTVGISRIKDRKMQWSNPPLAHMFGYETKEIFGKNPEILYAYQDDYQRVGKEGYDCIAKGDIFTSEVQMKRKDGTQFWCLVSGKAIDTANLSEGSLWIFQDISERRHAEQVQIRAQKLESVGIFAGGIAHDFNNLITGITGNLAIARRRLPKESKIQNNLQSAEKGCHHAAELSHRLLTFSKGGEPLQQASVIQNVIRDTVVLSLSGSNVVPEFTLPYDLPLVLADEGQIRQVFSNLSINAIDAMQSGGQFRVSAEQVSVEQGDIVELKSGTYVKVTFEDQGEGIPPAIIGKVFDPYFTTKTKGSKKGQGLGLAICHSIVKKHGGAITVESEPGQGTKFSVFLPIAETIKDVVKPAEKKPADVLPVPKRILVMDDEEMVRETLIEVLCDDGYEVCAVSDSKSAIEEYRSALEEKRSFDVAILDLTIQGGMGGVETLSELRKIDSHVKAIVSSGYADNAVIKNYQAYGFSGAIRKPYSFEDLLQVLDTV
jgi:PAS domain S-box-containing protein